MQPEESDDTISRVPNPSFERDMKARAARKPDDATTDFFVVRKDGNAVRPHWLVYRRSLNTCVDAASDAAAAIEKAVRMAQFCLLGGQSSQVHLRERGDAPWRTVWCPPHEQRRFP